MATPTPPLTQFHLFNELPTELRLKIYSLALSTPRTITLHCERQIIEGESRRATRFHNACPPPALLSVCRASRYEALLVYTASFFTSSGPNYLYICWEQDTIRCSDRIIEYFGKNERARVRRLELEVSDASYFGHFHMGTIREMRELRGLRLETKPNDGYGWSARSRDVLDKDFRLERLEDLGWVCPRVEVVEGGSGEAEVLCEGGAVISGWKEGDERPDLRMADL